MSEPSRARAPASRPVTAEDVADFLARHPEFLAERPDLLALIVPPSHRNGDNVADMQRFLIDRLRTEIAALKTSHKELIATTRTNMSSQRRVHEAALELLTARTFEELIEILRSARREEGVVLKKRRLVLLRANRPELS